MDLEAYLEFLENHPLLYIEEWEAIREILAEKSEEEPPPT